MFAELSSRAFSSPRGQEEVRLGLSSWASRGKFILHTYITEKVDSRRVLLWGPWPGHQPNELTCVRKLVD